MEPVPQILMISGQHGATAALTSFSLQQEKYGVIVEPKAANSVKRWAEVKPSLIIFDLSFPKNLLLQLVRALREETVTPIVVLTRSMTVEDQAELYGAGVDDCLIKPVSPYIFLAKIRVWLRHSWSVPSEALEPLKANGLTVLPYDRSAMTARGRRIELTNLELRLLYVLMSRAGHAVASDELIESVWGDASAADSTVLKSLVYRLRQKIEVNPPAPMVIQTVAGRGYVFVSSEPRPSRATASPAER